MSLFTVGFYGHSVKTVQDDVACFHDLFDGLFH